MSVSNNHTISSCIDDIDSVRLIRFSEANKCLGITNQLGHNWLSEQRYPIQVAKFYGCNYVRYIDLINHLNSLFEKEEQSVSAEGLYSNNAHKTPTLVKGGAR